MVAANPTWPEPALQVPTGMGVDQRGDLYVAQWGYSISKLNPRGKVLWTTVSPGPHADQPGPDIAVDRWGNIYVADRGIVKLSTAGRFLARWGRGRLARPTAIAVGGRGNVFALYPADEECCSLSARIEKLSPRGVTLVTIRLARGPGFYDAGPLGIAVGPSGNIYVTMWAVPYCRQLACSSANSPPVFIYKLSSTGKVLARWDGSRCCRTGGLAIDTAENLYLENDDPSADFWSVVEKRATSGRRLARWGDRGWCGPLQFGSVYSLTVDTHGTIYVGEGVDSSAGNLGLVHVLAADGTPRALRGACPGVPSVPLRSPRAVSVDSHGAMYVVNADPQGILTKFLPQGAWVTQWGDRWCGAYPDLGRENVTAVAIDSHDEIYVARAACDGQNGGVQKLSPRGISLHSWRRPPAAGAKANGPPERIRGLAVDREGTIYTTTESGSTSRLFRLLPRLGKWEQLDQWSSAAAPPDLWGVAVDRDGNIYAADVANHCIQKLARSGNPIACLSSDARYLALDSHGTIFVTNDRQVEKLSPTGAVLRHWREIGASPGQFRGPTGITVDSHDDVYVADSGNNRIQKLVSSR